MFLKFYKEKGDFSNKTIRKLSSKLNAYKIGHTGILDPLAEGLMIIATNDDTKLFQYISNKDKTYLAKAKLFVSSDTQDITGNLNFLEKKDISLSELKEAIEKASLFKTQIPPVFSAKKIKGKKAYDYARSGEKVEVPSQNIEVKKIELVSFDEENNEFSILTTVSEGTYIRTLLVDIAHILGTSCVMTYLKRTRVGNVDLGNIQPNEFQEIDFKNLFTLELVEVEDSDLENISHGRNIYLNKKNGKLFILSKHTKEICAVGDVDKGIFYPKKVFPKRIRG
ncbi:tRNA pseudouridine synthase B [Mycoplasmopsis canis UF31]|uniref:tRNA pseudouridine(55) synthase TruB n=1 Tax=Mycoplasmopsis canis TaxID=29555 RepID=UPI00025ADA16|nr:tRNA pseudouridine(55) synthase TruB [Mycoplasmopsis canis]EIE39702.1 tRNA pseudouridine synthase B [Mycoplasmopsis canis UF31]